MLAGLFALEAHPIVGVLATLDMALGASANLPVIVFIYGGGSTIGSSGMAVYGGETVAQRGAVFVNFNYRLGALFFRRGLHR